MSRRNILLLMFSALALMGCAFTELFTLGNPNADKSILFTVDYSGGLCVYGRCSANVTVHKDGSYTRTDGSGANVEGTLDQATIDELIQLIETADYNALRAVPFTDTCPIAYDGQELKYTFYTSKGTESLASCEVVIDLTAPLFAKVEAVLQQIPLPTS